MKSAPYQSTQLVFHTVASDNTFMQAAREFARNHAIDRSMPTGSVIVKDGVIVGYGANGSHYHETHVCERVKQNIPTGQGYELCEGCHPKNHSEPRAIADATTHSMELAGAELYLWGHWWCCEPCSSAMENAGITSVYLQENADRLFDRNEPNNIVGKQFDESQ